MRRESVELLYEQHGPALLLYASAMLGSRPAGEDVVQQVFLNLLRRSPVVPDSPSAYLYRAVRNAALNALRTSSRETELDEASWFRAPSGSREEAMGLQAALQELPAEQREVIVMKIWGDMTLEQIAGVLEISPNTAASRYRYGLEKLRQRFRPPEKHATERAVHAARK